MPPPAANAVAPYRKSRAIDALNSIAIFVGIAVLFFIDISQPRGVVDGVGYAGVVALCARFGRSVLYGVAALSSVLIVLAAFILPDAGISVSGELANRFFALVSVWIVAVAFSQRFNLEQVAAEREAALGRHRDALLKIAHRALLGTLPFNERIACATEDAANAIDVDRVGIFRLDADGVARCVDLFRTDKKVHDTIPDFPANRANEYLTTMNRELVVAADDVRDIPYMDVRRPMFDALDVRSLLTAGVFLEGRMAGVLSFARLHEPRPWTEEDIAFARSLAGFVALIFLTERNKQTLDALDMMGEGIVATDLGGRLFHANRFAKSLAALVADKKRVEEGRWLESDFPSSPVPLEGIEDTQETTFAGRELELHRVALPTGGTVTRIADRTLRNVTFRERARLQAQLQQAAKMEAIGQLAGGVAHDFNNILGAITGFAGFLQQDLPSGSEERGFAERILAACRRGKGLVEQILDFARARSVERQVVDLEPVLRGCEDFLLPTLLPGTSLSVSIDRNATCVSGSAVQLSQMITNLCVNARDAIGAKPGTISLSLASAGAEEIADLLAHAADPGEVLIGDLSLADHYVRMRVADTGEGIAQDALPRIFEPFFTTKGRQRGTGLGLAVVHGVVSSHNGLCHVKSAPGEGTTFSIYLPMVAGAAPSAAPSPPPASLGEKGRESVMVVDDEADIVDTLTIGLSRLGYDVVGVDDPLAALAAIEEDPDAWDVVVTDQVMPGLRGLELIGKIKAIKPAIRTILCTGFSDKTDEAVAAQGGADAYFRKPVEVAAVARAIRRTMAAPAQA